MKQIEMVPLSKIFNAEMGTIRPIHRELEEYENLRRTIATRGYNAAYPVLLRPRVDPITKKIISGEYWLVNGAHRTDIMRNLGATEIPAIINPTMTDEEAAIDQFQLNESVPTKISEKYEHLKRLCAAHPNKLPSEVAELHGLSPQGLAKILKFEKLVPAAKLLIEQDKIPTTKALALATVPVEFQEQFLERAQEMETKGFVQLLQDHKKEMQIAKRKGETSVEEKVVAKLLTLAETKIKLEAVTRDLKASNPDNIEEYSRLSGRKLAFEECLQIDAHTLQYAAALKEQTKTEKALAAARKKYEDQLKTIKELEARKSAVAEQQAEVEELSIA